MKTEIWTPRIAYTDDSTTGLLIVDGEQWKAATLEDRRRPDGTPKVYGQTCIPAGRYKLYKRWSPKFNRMVIWFQNVPDFEYIYAHSGNDHKDTLGCILLAQTRLSWERIFGNAFSIERKLFNYIDKRGWDDAYWTITDGPLAAPYLSPC